MHGVNDPVAIVLRDVARENKQVQSSICILCSSRLLFETYSLSQWSGKKAQGQINTSVHWVLLTHRVQ